MISIEDIPAEKRWEIAAKSASAMPLIYDMIFRKVLGEKYDEIERPLELLERYSSGRSSGSTS
jgi:hypothetical protein